MTVNGLNECEIVTLAKRRVDVKLLYNPGEDRKTVSWRSDEGEDLSLMAMKLYSLFVMVEDL